jgi:hypothetical protein
MRRSIAARGARPVLTAAVACTLGCLLGTVPAPASADSGRNALVQPFSAASPWNTPLGDRADYAPAGLGDGPVGIESVLVAPARPGTAASRVARQACALPDTGWLVLVDTAALAATSFRCRGGAAGAAAPVPLTGRGMPSGRATLLPAPGGAVTAAELAAERPIRHALALSVPGTRFPAGTLLALPPRLAAGVEPRTATGRRLLAALRDYGAYVAVTRTTAVRIRLSTDAPTVGSAEVPVLDAAARADIATLVGALAVVTNDGPGAVGGPGRRRVPPPPALAGAPHTAPPASPSPSPSTVATTPPGPAPVAVATGPVVQVTPHRASAGVLWGLGALACALLAVGLRAGRRLAGLR